MVRHVNLTPRWSEILPTWLMLFEQAVTGDCTDPDLVKDNAKAELRRMAEAADRYGDLIAGIRLQEANSHADLQEVDAYIEALLADGREAQLSDRNTVKED